MPRWRLAAAVVLGALLGAGDVASAATFAELKARYEKEKGETFQTRYATLGEFVALGTVEALRFLEGVAENDADASIRSNALFTLARVDVPEAREVLLRFYKQGPNERSNVLSAWVSYRKEELPKEIVDEVLGGKDISARSNVVRYLATQKDARFLAEARRFLADFPGNAASISSTLTSNPSPETAQLLLETYDDTRSYDRDSVPKFFAGAAPEVKYVLVEAIRAGRDPLLERAAAIAARGKVGECEGVLVAAARGAKIEARAALFLEAAGKVGLATPEGGALALEWLGGTREPLLLAAVRALRGRATVEAIPLLIPLVASKGELLRTEARITLERVTGQQFGERLDLWQAWWRDTGPTFDPALVKPPAEDALDQVLVDLALAKGAAALRALAVREPKPGKGPWEYAGHPVGTTALVLLALHAAGTDPKEKTFAAGLRWLLEQPVPEQTYDAGLVAMTLETVGGKKHRTKIAEATKLLVASQNAKGFWGYPSGEGDHSNSQYAVLGLRHAARAGVSVPAKVWKAAREHWLATQNEDGGWSYVPQSRKDVSASSMTAAGVSSLLICLENGESDQAQRDLLQAAIDRGLTALGTLMRLDKDGLYALYGIERAAVLGRRSALGGKPWYVPGATRIVDEQGRDGFWVGTYEKSVDSALAILFLKKATAPLAPTVTR